MPPPSECGYTGLPIASSAPPISGASLFAYGACEEYSTVADLHGSLDYFGRFVQTEGATFCADGGLTLANVLYWFADLLIILGFMWRLGRMERQVAARADEYALTTSDYAVMLRGLKRGMPLEEARKALQLDLEGLGYSRKRVDHIEFGICIIDELAVRSALVAKRAKLTALTAEAGADSVKPGVETAKNEVKQAEAELAGHLQRPQLSSGHAFVVFQLEEERNKLINHFRQSHDGLRHSADSASYVVASVGPEPSNVIWENLEVTAEVRAQRWWESTRATVWVLSLSGVFLVLIQFAKRTFTTDYSLGQIGDTSQLGDPSVVIALVAALIIAITACLVRRTVSAMVTREAHETQSQFEAGLMWKLCGAFASNNVVMPIAVSCVQSLLSHGGVVGQPFYERTGSILFAIVLMTIQRFTADLPRALQCVSLVKRHIMARASTANLESLWDPPSMRIALAYAQLFWLFACAILYGPLSSFFYGLASVFTLFSFGCTKFGVVYWYKRPPAITTELGGMFRILVVMLLPLQLLIKLFVRRAAEPNFAPHSFAFFATGIGMCVVAFRATRGGFGASSSHSDYEMLTELDTRGVRYEDAARASGFPIDHYDNPYRRGPRLRERKGYFGEVPPPASFVATSAETLEQNSAALTASLPYESLPAPPLEDIFGSAV